MKAKDSIWDKIKALIWIAAGLAVLLFLAKEGIHTFQVMRGDAKVSANVVSAYDDEREEYDGRRVGIVTVVEYEFFVKGKRYTGHTEGKRGSWIEGDKIAIEYNKNDPNQNRVEGDRKPVGDYFLFLLMGGMFLYFCLKINVPMFFEIRKGRYLNGGTGNDNIKITGESAINITADYGACYADCNDENLLFKPVSRLPADADTVMRCMKLAYKIGSPLPENIEYSYSHCYPQLAFFIPDKDFARVQQYFERFFEATQTDEFLVTRMDYTLAMSNISVAPSVATIKKPIQGSPTTPQEFFADMNQFFQNEFLDDAPDDEDREWAKNLAKTCWARMKYLIEDWEIFKNSVQQTNI